MFDPAYPNWTEAHHTEWQTTKRQERRTEQCIAGCDGIASPHIVVPALMKFVKEYLSRVECSRQHKLPISTRVGPALEAQARVLRDALEKT